LCNEYNTLQRQGYNTPAQNPKPGRRRVPGEEPAKGRGSHLSGKEAKPIMKNKKNFSQSLRQHFREGMLLYAAANSRYPVSEDLMRLYQQAVEEE